MRTLKGREQAGSRADKSAAVGCVLPCRLEGKGRRAFTDSHLTRGAKVITSAQGWGVGEKSEERERQGSF